jgi:hypothetical protein
MNKKALKSVLVIVLFIAFSCDEPETVVTNYVHPDGSVTRHIEMRNSKNNFKLTDLQVPFDSTWIIKDTINISEKKDTTWIKTAEKLFKNVDEINKSYLSDSGANKDISRKATFVRKFRWFNTEYRFSEWIDKKMSYGYLLRDFLNAEELTFFYTPGSINDEKLKSADSVKYKLLADSVKKKIEKWSGRSFVSEWIGEFSKLTAGKAGSDISRESLKSRENEILSIVEKYDNKFDSIWATGIILKEMIGEKNAATFKTEADTAIAIVTRKFFVNFKNYSVRIVMPGKVIGTNGFIDKTDILLWPVSSDFFMTEPYEMWAESKSVNNWAWIVTGVFIVFVLTGLMIKLFSKRTA